MRFTQQQLCFFVFSCCLSQVIGIPYCGVGEKVWSIVPGYSARVPAVIMKILSSTEFKVTWEYSLDFCIIDSTNCIVSIDKIWDRFGNRCSSLSSVVVPTANATTTTPIPTGPPPEDLPAANTQSHSVNIRALIPAVVLLTVAALLWLCVRRRQRASVSAFEVQLANHELKRNKASSPCSNEPKILFNIKDIK